MPELPDLEIIREYLMPHLSGAGIEAADIRRPLVVRNLLTNDADRALLGRHFAEITRRGKFLLFVLDDGTYLVVNPMLAGRFYYGTPLARHRKRDVLVLQLDNGLELHYHDAKDMGKVYLTRDLAQVPTFESLGPDAMAPDLTFEEFQQRLKRHRGEIKGVLTNQSFVAGIGNAYADEICWQAELYPFRRRPDLGEEEVGRLYGAMRSVLRDAIETLRQRVGDEIHIEIRDFLAIHGRTDAPCPRCGTAISKVTRARRTTNFCRTCQPGLMIGRR
jgi:formamidopyrimidine-DNA glycosylase